MKNSPRHRLCGALSILSMLTLNVQPGISWDAGPMKCQHNVCSGGAQAGQIVLEKAVSLEKGKPPTKTIPLQLRGNTHLWVVNNGLELLHSGEGHNADTEKIYAALNAQPCRALWEAELFNADEPPLVETAGAYGTHFYNAAGKDMEGNPTTITRYTGSTVAFLKDGKVLTAIKGNELGNARDNAYGYLYDMENRLHIGATGKTSELDARLKGLRAGACQDVGWALHYFTDMTQPMHAASFSAMQTSKAKKFVFITGQPLNLSGFALHAAYEYWVPAVQAKFPANKTRATNLGTNIAMVNTQKADDIFVKTSIHFNGFSKGLLTALTTDRPLVPAECLIDAVNQQNDPTGRGKGADAMHYQGSCFALDPVNPALIKQTGAILEDAYVATASFIYAALFNGPGSEPSKK